MPSLDSLSQDSAGSDDSVKLMPLGYDPTVLMCLLITAIVLFVNAQSLAVADILLEQAQAHYEAPDVDALVFVAAGPVAGSLGFGWSVKAAIETGGWNGTVVVITDGQAQVEQVLRNEFSIVEKNETFMDRFHYVSHALEVESLPVHSSKLAKCKLFQILDYSGDEFSRNLEHILYIDADIVVGKPLGPFLDTLHGVWNRNNGTVDMAMFYDGKAFTAGFCVDCEEWNTGVMSLKKGKSSQCMEQWCRDFSEYGTSDQKALDRVRLPGRTDGEQCMNVEAFDMSHVRMMKDVFVVAGLIPKKTFNHFTKLLQYEQDEQQLSAIHRNSYRSVLRDFELDLELLENRTGRNATDGRSTASVSR